MTKWHRLKTNNNEKWDKVKMSTSVKNGSDLKCQNPREPLVNKFFQFITLLLSLISSCPISSSITSMFKSPVYSSSLAAAVPRADITGPTDPNFLVMS